MLRVLVCGGRNYSNVDELYRVLDALREEAPIEVIIEGGARGADLLARGWAEARGVAWREFPADWNRHGRGAGHIRNQRMLDDGKPDLVVAFPGGAGTADMVRRSRLHGVPVRTVGDPKKFPRSLE